MQGKRGGFSKFFREEHASDPASMSSCLRQSPFPATVRFLSFTGWQVCKCHFNQIFPLLAGSEGHSSSEEKTPVKKEKSERSEERVREKDSKDRKKRRSSSSKSPRRKVEAEINLEKQGSRNDCKEESPPAKKDRSETERTLKKSRGWPKGMRRGAAVKSRVRGRPAKASHIFICINNYD